MKAIYPAGPISSGDLIQFLRNINAGNVWTARLAELGFAPFPVFSDCLYLMNTRPGFTVQDIKDISLEWLRRSDAVAVIPGCAYLTSPGTMQEIAEAKQLGIPVFYTAEELGRWAGE